MSDAIVGVGAQFKRENDGSSGVFTALAEITNIDGPNQTRDMVDVTNLDSSGGYREKIPGFRDPGDVSLDMNFTMATYNQMLDDFQSDDSVNYQIVLNDTGATTFEFAGYVSSVGLAVPTDDKVSSSCTVSVTGEITYTT